jgi:hypothetical protein
VITNYFCHKVIFLFSDYCTCLTHVSINDNTQSIMPTSRYYRSNIVGPPKQNREEDVLSKHKEEYSKVWKNKQKKEIRRDEIVCYEKGCDDLDEYGKEICCFDSHSKHVHPISRKRKGWDISL